MFSPFLVKLPITKVRTYAGDEDTYNDIGEEKSKLWEILGSRAKSKDGFEANIEALMSPPEDRRRARTFGSFSDFVDCVKAELKVS